MSGIESLEDCSDGNGKLEDICINSWSANLISCRKRDIFRIAMPWAKKLLD
jgi:hypothetical protein